MLRLSRVCAAALLTVALLGACDDEGGSSSNVLVATDTGAKDTSGGAADPGAEPDTRPLPTVPQGSCDLLAGAGYCQDYTGFDEAALAPYEATCGDSEGTWSVWLCPREQAVGGCQVAEPGLGAVTTWYYTGSGWTTGSIRSICESDGSGVFVAP